MELPPDRRSARPLGAAAGRFRSARRRARISGARHLPWPWLKRWWATHHLHACAVIANRVMFSRKHGPKIAVLSLLVHVLTVVIAWCVVRSIAAPVVFSQIFQLVPPVMLITMLPISIAGWGVREATMGLAFGYAGLMPTKGSTSRCCSARSPSWSAHSAGWSGSSARKKRRGRMNQFRRQADKVRR